MLRYKVDSCSKNVAVIALLIALPLQRFAAGQLDATLTADGFRPGSSSAAGPHIVWSFPVANSWGTFTITSEASNSPTRYVSFAFAYNARMVDAILVVDCYEIDGVVMLGTSRNSDAAGSRVNIVDVTPSDQVQLLSATKRDGVLTCSFLMQFPPTLDVYVLLATGNLALTADASLPEKVYHGPNGRFVSDSTIGQMVTTNVVTSSSTTLSSLSNVNMLTADGFRSVSSPAAGPQIVWSTPTANARGTFTLSNEASNSATSYVSFAFAYDAVMVEVILVVDCYEINGAVMLGTSRNAEVAGTLVNIVDVIPSDQVQLLSATKRNGVLTCSFLMRFPPTLEVYVFLATGNLALTANASFPEKLYHGPNGRFVSDGTVGQLLVTTGETSLSTTLSS